MIARLEHAVSERRDVFRFVLIRGLSLLRRHSLHSHNFSQVIVAWDVQSGFYSVESWLHGDGAFISVSFRRSSQFSTKLFLSVTTVAAKQKESRSVPRFPVNHSGSHSAGRH